MKKNDLEQKIVDLINSYGYHFSVKDFAWRDNTIRTRQQVLDYLLNGENIESKLKHLEGSVLGTN